MTAQTTTPQPAQVVHIEIDDLVAIPPREDPRLVELAKQAPASLAAQAERDRLAKEAADKAAEDARVAELARTKQAQAATVPMGTSNLSSSYTAGQCTWYVASRRSVPPYWGNANQWYANAQAEGWATGSTPRVGAIAWTGAGYYGHVAIVEAVTPAGVLLSEMNGAFGPFNIDQIVVDPSAYYYIY